MSGRVDATKLRKGRYKAVPGEFYDTPKEVWSFRTPAAPGSPREIARRFLTANAALFELEEGFVGLRVRKVIRSLGADHVILNQVHAGLRVHRGYVTVHLDHTGRVFLAKNRSVPARLLPEKFDGRLTRAEAETAARRSLPSRGGRPELRETERLWVPRRDELLPAWKFRLTRERPRQEWIVYVNARSGAILSRYDNLAAAGARGFVFDPSPVTALGDHESLLIGRGRAGRPPPEAYRRVTLKGLHRGGFLSGKRVTTAPTGKRRVQCPDGRFLFRCHERGFEEVMVYYHVDAALRRLEKLGYTGSRALFRKPVQVNVNGSPEDNSWYSPWDQQLTFGTGAIDDAEDGETILHELGHAIQDAICPDFGQSAEAAAMGEGFGDYWAASFFESRKPERYVDSVMSWDGLFLGLEYRLDPPCLRRLDGRGTYADFEPRGDEHENGEIWSAALWEVHRALGTETAARVILDSHFQLDGFTTFARGARAILDADENLEKGRHRSALERIFRRRKIGPL